MRVTDPTTMIVLATATLGGMTTTYVGGHYEKTGYEVTKYYYAGDRRIAMRTGGQTYYLLPDHLGGTHITANSSGAELGKLLYKPWGETRVSTGTRPTTWRFTGQREDASMGLYYFNARYYDPVLGRFTQPDSIVPDPGDPQALNRYSYVLNNPVKYTDPTGHNPACAAWMGGGPLGGIAALVCEVGSAIASSWPQVQALAVELQQLAPLAAELPAAMDPNVDSSAVPSNVGNTAPGNLDPNNRDPNRFTFKSNSSLRSHFRQHVLDRPEEAWEDVLGVARSEFDAARSDPGKLARLQDAYAQVGQQTSSASNLIGAQAQGQRVFVDTSNKVVSILQGDRFLSIFRISRGDQFVATMEAQGQELAPGVTLEALQRAMAY